MQQANKPKKHLQTSYYSKAFDWRRQKRCPVQVPFINISQSFQLGRLEKIHISTSLNLVLSETNIQTLEKRAFILKVFRLLSDKIWQSYVFVAFKTGHLQENRNY